MLDFSKDSVFNLRRIADEKINKNVAAILTDDEMVLGVYHTIRDQVVFTDKRVITVEVEGVTGMRQEIFTLPYKRVQYFMIQTVGFAEIIPDAELVMYFTDGMKATFEFQGNSNILEIGKEISDYALD